MNQQSLLSNPGEFSKVLFEKMQAIDLAVQEMELYEFRYALNHLVPDEGWGSVAIKRKDVIEELVNNEALYSRIKIKEKKKGWIVEFR